MLVLALSLRAAQLQTRAAVDELVVVLSEGGTARLDGGSGLGRALQRRFGLGEANRCLVRAICSHLSRRPVPRFGISDRQALCGQPGEPSLRLGDMVALALQVGGELGESSFGFASGGERPL